jgi:hypothetical protein
MGRLRVSLLLCVLAGVTALDVKLTVDTTNIGMGQAVRLTATVNQPSVLW